MASSKDISPLRHLRARSFVSSGMWKPSASTEPTLLLTMAISSMVDCMIQTELNILIWASRTEGSRTYGVETYTTTGVRNRPTKIGQMRCRIKEAAPRAIDSEDRATSLCNGMEVSSTRDDNVASSIEHDLYLLQVAGSTVHSGSYQFSCKSPFNPTYPRGGDVSPVQRSKD